MVFVMFENAQQAIDDPLAILGLNVRYPELAVFTELLRLVAHLPFDVRADIGRAIR